MAYVHTHSKCHQTEMWQRNSYRMKIQDDFFNNNDSIENESQTNLMNERERERAKKM